MTCVADDSSCNDLSCYGTCFAGQDLATRAVEVEVEARDVETNDVEEGDDITDLDNFRRQCRDGRICPPRFHCRYNRCVRNYRGGRPVRARAL